MFSCTDLRRSTDLSHSAGMFTDLRRSNRSVYLPTSSGRETPVGVVLRNTGYRTTAHRHGVSSMRLLKLQSSAAPLQSRFWPSELKSPNRHRLENTFARQDRRTARLPPADQSQDTMTKHTLTRGKYCAQWYGPPQAPLTARTV